MSSAAHVPLKVFCAYAREDIKLYEELKNHLAWLWRQERIELWCDQEIFPGEQWEEEIAKKLKNADIILLLISSNFLASNYCYNTELTYALQRHAAREVRVIPIILLSCVWRFPPLSSLQALPRNGKAIFKEKGVIPHDILAGVALEIGKVVSEIDRRRINRQEKKDNTIATSMDAAIEVDRESGATIKQSTRGGFIPSPDSPDFFQSLIYQSVPPPEELQLSPSGELTPTQDNDANNTPTRVTLLLALIRKQSLLAGLSLLLIFLIVGGTIFGVSDVIQKLTPQSTPIPISNNIGPNYIDNTQIVSNKVSDGRYALDTLDPLKKNAAQAFWSGKTNSSSWSNLFTKHTLNDGESCIYAQDQKISSPFFIVVAAVTLDRTDTDPTLSAGSGEEELQGICLRQMYYNGHLAKNAKMHMQVLIANIGTRFSAEDLDILKQIQMLAKGSNFLGVIGLPFSTTVDAYMPDFSNAHIPVISPSASSSKFDSMWLPYFHRVVSDTNEEGQYAGQYAMQLLKQKNLPLAQDILVFQASANSNEPYSSTLGEGFTNAFALTEQPTTRYYEISLADPFKTLVDSSINQYKLIFCACFSNEFSLLNKDLTTYGYQGIKMGGEALYDLEGYPENNQTKATPDPSYKNIYFTSFAFPDEVSLLCKVRSCQDSPDGELLGFYTHFCQTFGQSHSATSHCSARPESHVMLSYDATSALLNAYKDVLHSGKQSITFKDMKSDTVNFQGITGQIRFTSGSNIASHKIILALCIDGSSPPTAHLLDYSDINFFEAVPKSSQPSLPNGCVNAHF